MIEFSRTASVVVGRAHQRGGFALGVALVAILVLATIGALANLSAGLALREARALSDDANGAAARTTLRARVAVTLRSRTRDELVAAPSVLASPDTTMRVVALAWPWYRVTVAAPMPRGADTSGVTASGSIALVTHELVAEIARSSAPALPACGAIVIASEASITTDHAYLEPGSRCTNAVSYIGRERWDAFDTALSAALIPRSGGPATGERVDSVLAARSPDTVTVEPGQPRVWYARQYARIPEGVNASGLVVAPQVDVGESVFFRGYVVARDSAHLSPSATVTEGRSIAEAALAGASRLILAGRRGLLLPP